MSEIAPHTLFAGVWDVTQATMPNGTFAYTGTISVHHHGATYILDWDISAGRYVGIGLPLDNHLFVSCGEQFGGLGLALFRLRTDASVTIQWCTPELVGSAGTGIFTTPWTGTFAGEHQLAYYLPDGRLYGEWTLAIEPVDQVYELTWRKGDVTHFRGIGLDTPQGLAVGWYPDIAQLAFLDYWLDAHDPQHMRAVWALGGYTALGSELLTRT